MRVELSQRKHFRQFFLPNDNFAHSATFTIAVFRSGFVTCFARIWSWGRRSLPGLLTVQSLLFGGFLSRISALLVSGVYCLGRKKNLRSDYCGFFSFLDKKDSLRSHQNI